MLGRHRHRNLAARLDRLEGAISRLEQEAVSARLAAETRGGTDPPERRA